MRPLFSVCLTFGLLLFIVPAHAASPGRYHNDDGLSLALQEDGDVVRFKCGDLEVAHLAKTGPRSFSGKSTSPQYKNNYLVKGSIKPNEDVIEVRLIHYDPVTGLVFIWHGNLVKSK